MASDDQIQFIEHKSIDIKKWDECIDKASNGLIYAKSEFLDLMCTNWAALVQNDYERVMPIPWRKKWGFAYIYPPYFIAALGVFGDDLNPAIINSFFDRVPERFKYWELDLNENNDVKADSKIQLTKRKNFLLDLNKSVEELRNNYSRLAKRKLIVADNNDLKVHRGVDPGIIIQYYQEHYEEKNRIIPPDVYRQLNALFDNLSKENFETYLIKTKDEVVAFYLVLVDKRNIYSLIGGSTDQGKKLGAFYLATDAAITDFAISKRTFRFEGSDKPGIAFFNAQFGPVETDYLHLKNNKLPWPLKYLK